MPLPTTLPTAYEAGKFLQNLQMPKSFPEMGDFLSFCFKIGPAEAAAFLVVGVLMLMFGVNLYKAVVTINAMLIGAALGLYVGDKAGNENVGALIGGFVMAAIALPLMKHTAGTMVLAVGGIVGAFLWRMFAVGHQELYWVGSLLGGITFGLLSMLIFRGCLMIFTSLQGALMAIVGLLGLLLKYKGINASLTQFLSAKNFALPLAIFIPTILGVLYQQMPGAAAKAPVKK